MSGTPPLNRSVLDDEPLEAAESIATYLHVPVTWVYMKAESLELPSLKVGRYRRFRRSEVAAWLAARREEERQAVGASRNLDAAAASRARRRPVAKRKEA